MTRQTGTDAPASDTITVEDEKPQLTLLTRDAILAADDIKCELVEVPEWSGSLYVKGMTGHQRDQFEEAQVEMRGRSRTMNLSNFRAQLVARTAVDGPDPRKAKRLFSDADVEVLGRKSAAGLTRVVVVAQRLSGLTDEQVNELTAELKDAPSAGSGSD